MTLRAKITKSIFTEVCVHLTPYVGLGEARAVKKNSSERRWK